MTKSQHNYAMQSEKQMKQPLSTFRAFYRSLKADFKLLTFTPKPDFGDNPNLNYWQKRPQSWNTPLNTFQVFRVAQISYEVEKSQSILDLGSGTGAQCAALSKQGFRITASDFTNDSLKALTHLDIDTMTLNLELESDLKKIDCFDVVVACEVFEHLSSPEKVIKRAQKSNVKKLIFSVPNSGYYIYRLRLLFGRFPCQWRTHPGEHTRFWTTTDMKWWLKNLGIQQSSKVQYYEGWPILNKIVPNLFAKGIFVAVNFKQL